MYRLNVSSTLIRVNTCHYQSVELIDDNFAVMMLSVMMVILATGRVLVNPLHVQVIVKTSSKLIYFINTLVE